MNKWQSDILDAIANKKAKHYIISTPRMTGKSAYKRLFDDIYARPIEDIELTDSKLHGKRIYAARPHGGSWLNMEAWCVERFGPVGDIWNLEIQRWYMNDRTFFFRDEADRTMFVLKWR